MSPSFYCRQCSRRLSERLADTTTVRVTQDPQAALPGPRPAALVCSQADWPPYPMNPASRKQDRVDSSSQQLQHALTENAMLYNRDRSHRRGKRLMFETLNGRIIDGSSCSFNYAPTDGTAIGNSPPSD